MGQTAPSSIYAAVTSTMMLLANIQPPDRWGSGERLLFSKARQRRLLHASVARVGLDARAPNQFPGLASADHATRGLLSMRAISG